MITRKEVEAEGWTPDKDCPNTTFRKEKYHLHIFKEYNQIWINKMNSTNTNYERIFAGKCEGLEDFRKIVSLVC